MLERLTAQPADKILGLMAAFREDPRPGKVDLGVGVYKNAEGVTPIMRAVKTAEQQLWRAETTKSYTGLIGDPAFNDAMVALVLGDAVERDLDADQIDRLRDGDVDALRTRIPDRLDRLYAAKVYLQSDQVTANSAATRAVVEEIADREFERQRADLHDGESERGETH